MRLIEIPDDSIIRIPIMCGEDTIGERCLDLSGLPTSDAAPIVHGKWIMDDLNKNPYIRICSVCYHSRPRMNDHNFYCKTNYCPNCGAKMDLKE